MQCLLRIASSSTRIFKPTCSTFRPWTAKSSLSNSANRCVSQTLTQRKAEKPISPTGSQTTSTHPARQQPDYQMVFKFPYIVHIRALCRLKIYQTAFTLVMVPGMAVAYVCDVTTAQQCTIAVGAATLACGVLYIVSELFRRLVGIVYLNRKKDTVKLAHLTFWGNRRDVVMPLKDVVVFSEVPSNKSSNLYHKLKRYSTEEEYFYYVSRFGGVLVPEQFELIFGQDVPYPK